MKKNIYAATHLVLRISDQVQKFASNIEFLYFRLYNIALSTETYSINQDTEILYLMPISVLDNKF